jgi:AAA+ superfamily predicted ATPase
VSSIYVLVAAASPDLKAEVIAESVAARSDMTLVHGRCVAVPEIDGVFDDVPASEPGALILVGDDRETNDLIDRLLAERAGLVVVYVDVTDDIVRFSVSDPRLDSLLNALRHLVEGAGVEGQMRVAHVELRASRPLLQASVEWVHRLFREAVAQVPDENGDVHGLSVTRTTILQALDDTSATRGYQDRDLLDADVALDAALDGADSREEPLAAAVRGLHLGPLELRMLLLGLAPELDLRFQRCIGFLLDDMSRRVGTFGLYSTLLGSTAQIRGELAVTGAFGTWPIFEGAPGQQPPADEPLRLDPFLAQWLLGLADALERDPRVRRVLRLVPWPGAGLLSRHEERIRGAALIGKLLDRSATAWVVLSGPDVSASRALLEHGDDVCQVRPIRVDAAFLAGTDVVAIEECALRLGRMRQLTGAPIVVDLSGEVGDAEAETLRTFLSALGETGGTTAVISSDDALVVRLLGSSSFESIPESALPNEALVAAVKTAASGADVHLADDAAEGIIRRYPLRLDGLERAMSLARSRPKDYNVDRPELARFISACKQVAAEGLSRLADRIEPIFDLDDVVLPADQKSQLVEIVDNVRLAPRVLDEWRFRDQLPYGRGVTALFFGPSGTGKTMAAIAIARRLDIQLLRLDLSRVVSKYIGDTEKNIDRIFTDAQRSGSAILFDEADALLGKRSEVKDAHDRYANIEVAYLLQRMEAFDGLAILTTNMRQNLEAALLRRLRFIIDFPRPDVDARERIWRQCLPEESHLLDDQAFRQLARKIDLTGGHIRQMTLRAAFIAAAAESRIQLTHVAQAARAELAKLGMPPVELDVPTSRRAA